MFVAIVAGTFWLLTTISNRNSQAEERLERIGRPKSLADLEMTAHESRQRFAGLKEAFSNLGAAMEPQTELEKNTLRVRAGQRRLPQRERAPAVYQGLRLAVPAGVPGARRRLFLPRCAGSRSKPLQWIVIARRARVLTCRRSSCGYLRSTRQQEIFLTLPDALDLLVVCVESGLGPGRGHAEGDATR